MKIDPVKRKFGATRWRGASRNVFCRRFAQFRIADRVAGLSAAAAFFASAMLATPAVAQEDMLTARLSRHVTWDTNVFRLSDGAADPQLARGTTGKSDQIATTTVGLSVDKAFSLQQFRFNVSQVATRHDKFSTLDRDAFNYTALWQWQLTPRISGALSADRAESAISFLDTQDLQRNVAVTVNRNATVDGWLFGGWHLLGGISETKRENTAAFVSSPSDTQINREFGLRYIAASQSSVTATRRLRSGVNTGQAVDLVNFIDSAFKVMESELNAAWIVSGKSTLNGRLTRIERRHEHVPQRDFSAVAGEFSYVWMPTRQLSVNFSALRAVVPFTPSTSISYRVDDTLSFAPSWRVTDKATLRMRVYRQVTDFLGAVVPVAGPARRDTLRSIEFGADWVPFPKLTVNANLRRDLRSSTDAGFGFDTTVASVNASLAF